jgi:hypothetical protein
MCGYGNDDRPNHVLCVGLEDGRLQLWSGLRKDAKGKVILS